MILHIANLDKFIPPFIKFVNENFDGKGHLFCVLGNNKKYPIPQQNNLKISKPTLIGAIKHYLRVFKDVQRADKVILHGLFDIRLVILLSTMPWVLKKCYWIIWGGDLYSYKTPKLRRIDRIKEAVRRFFIKRVGYLVTYIDGDIDLARQWYSAKGKFYRCLCYPSNTFNLIDEDDCKSKTTTQQLNILLGNSADPSNNHFSSLELLYDFRERGIIVYVPLSYGNEEHAKKVIAKGEGVLGDKFKPILEFIPSSEYYHFLKKIDIAIFNHERQQAMGNTIALLGLGKTVFMRTSVAQWMLLRNLGIKIFSIEEFGLTTLNSDEAFKNKEIIRRNFSKKVLTSQLKEIFE